MRWTDRRAGVGRWLVAGALASAAPAGAVGDGPARPAQTQKGKSVDASAPQQSALLGRLRDRHRPILVFGPGADDPRVARQQHAWVGPLPEAGLKDRDMVVVAVLAAGESKAGGDVLKPDEVRQLRDGYKVAADAFAVILIGRDGGEKARWTEPVSAQEIFGKVDAMPMRQREVQAKGGGSE